MILLMIIKIENKFFRFLTAKIKKMIHSIKLNTTQNG